MATKRSSSSSLRQLRKLLARMEREAAQRVVNVVKGLRRRFAAGAGINPTAGPRGLFASLLARAA